MNIIKILMVLLFTTLTNNVNAGENNMENTSPDLTGKIYLYDYGSYAYEINILSTQELHWKLVKGSFEGAVSGKNAYVISQISEDLIFISWMEDSGYKFYNLMDFKSGKLTTHADTGEAALSINLGKVSVKP